MKVELKSQDFVHGSRCFIFFVCKCCRDFTHRTSRCRAKRCSTEEDCSDIKRAKPEQKTEQELAPAPEQAVLYRMANYISSKVGQEIKPEKMYIIMKLVHVEVDVLVGAFIYMDRIRPSELQTLVATFSVLHVILSFTIIANKFLYDTHISNRDVAFVLADTSLELLNHTERCTFRVLHYDAFLHPDQFKIYCAMLGIQQ
jgi:hypothetical protein